MEGEWLGYGGDQFKEENSHVTEVVSLRETELCYRGRHFNGEKMLITELVSVGRENGYVTKVGQFNGRENGHVTGGQFNGGSIVMLWSWPVQSRENSYGRMVMSQNWTV